MDPGELAAGDVPDHFAGQLQSVVTNACSINRDHDPIDVPDIQVVTHQKHRSCRELKDVLAGTVRKDGLQAPEAS